MANCGDAQTISFSDCLAVQIYHCEADVVLGTASVVTICGAESSSAGDENGLDWESEK